MLRNDIVDLYNCLYGRRKPPCLSGAMYQRVAEAPPTALESAEIPGLTHRVRILKEKLKKKILNSKFILTNTKCFIWITTG